ncbi:MAG: hypothetical protein IPH12_05625 [Saprospirales bacterium]|nr:hypothetical protein [Saprospirales bacterium]
MKRLFTLALVFYACLAHAQYAELNSEQVLRLSQFAKLYGHIKFFHPYPGYKNIDLDAAFAEAAPRLLEAGTDAEQAAVLRQFLDVLHDPVTTVILKNDGQQADLTTGTARDSLQYFFNPDSILIVRTNNYYGFENYVQLLENLEIIKKLAPSAKGVLFDMRATRPLRSDAVFLWPLCFDYTGVASLFLKTPALTYSQRMRMHSGFPPETGGSSGGYFSGYYTKSGDLVKRARAAVAAPVAVLINSYSDVPAQALPLSQAPGCALFVVGNLPDGSLVTKTTFAFSPSLDVNIRLSEVLDDKGNPGAGKYRLFPESAAWDEPEQAALAFLKGQSPQYSTPVSAAAAEIPEAPSFDQGSYPTLGYRLLAIARIWSIIHYFFAYKDLIPGDWDQCLTDHLPQFVQAKDSLEYALAVARMYRNIQDGHGFIASPALHAYVGRATVPVSVDFIEGQFVVTGIGTDSTARQSGLAPGDVILEVNGEKRRCARSASADL